MTDEIPSLSALLGSACEDASLDVMDALLQALARTGGVDYLARQAEENPRAFLTLLGRLMPLQKRGHKAKPLVVVLERFTPWPEDGDEPAGGTPGEIRHVITRPGGQG